MNKFLRMATVLMACLAIVGCSNKPDDKEAIERINKASVPGKTVMRNIKRTNGYKEGELYKTIYTYDAVAETGFHDLLKLHMKESEDDVAKMDDLTKSQMLIATMAAIWGDDPNIIKNDDGGAMISITRRNLEQSTDGASTLAAGKLISSMKLPEINDYISHEAKGHYDRQIIALTAVQSTLDDGFKEDSKKGDILNHLTWTATFRKTENGWQIAD